MGGLIDAPVGMSFDEVCASVVVGVTPEVRAVDRRVTRRVAAGDETEREVVSSESLPPAGMAIRGALIRGGSRVRGGDFRADVARVLQQVG